MPFHTHQDSYIKKTDNNKCQWGCGVLEPSHITGGNVKPYSHVAKQFGSLLKN